MDSCYRMLHVGYFLLRALLTSPIQHRRFWCRRRDIRLDMIREGGKGGKWGCYSHDRHGQHHHGHGQMSASSTAPAISLE